MIGKCYRCGSVWYSLVGDYDGIVFECIGHFDGEIGRKTIFSVRRKIGERNTVFCVIDNLPKSVLEADTTVQTVAVIVICKLICFSAYLKASFSILLATRPTIAP